MSFWCALPGHMVCSTTMFYCSCYSFWAVSLLFPAGHALQLFYPISCTGHCARLRAQISSRTVECHFGFHCVSWKPWRLFCSNFGASSWHILYTVVRSDPLKKQRVKQAHTNTNTHLSSRILIKIPFRGSSTLTMLWRPRCRNGKGCALGCVAATARPAPTIAPIGPATTMPSTEPGLGALIILITRIPFHSGSTAQNCWR